ncbi:hypothetical protein [Novosphingobium sp. 9]|uniref:hypothetical protein n=1 Tax=Novosphingobium sp. 9 TaxID=2025349 RepID=UPI0021B517C1|nr:hypothetical protein [Novosphingobium sp. 9]
MPHREMSGWAGSNRMAIALLLLCVGAGGAVTLGVFAARLVPASSHVSTAPDSLAPYRGGSSDGSAVAYADPGGYTGGQGAGSQSAATLPDGYYASAYPFAGRDGEGGGPGTDDMGEIPLDPDLAALSDPPPAVAASDGGRDGGMAGETAIAAAAVAHAVQAAEAGLAPVSMPPESGMQASAL